MNEIRSTITSKAPSTDALRERIREAHTTNAFKPGDLALHKGNQLDARPVEVVEGDMIRLRIGSFVTAPVPAANYVRVSA